MDCSTFLLPCRGGIYAARGLGLTAPLTVHTVGRGLDPSAAARGLAALQAPISGIRRGGIRPSRRVCVLRGASGTPPPTTIRGAGNDGKTPPYVLPFTLLVGEGFIPPGTCAPPAGRRGRRPLQPSGEQAMTARPRPTSPAKAHTTVILPLRAPSPIPDILLRWP